MRRLLIALSFLFVAAIVQPQTVAAQSRYLSYDRYDVDIVVNSDSTVEITEKMDVVLNGSYKGVQRGITTNDTQLSSRCRNNNLNCGGFDSIELLEVRVDGKLLLDGEYEAGTEKNEEDDKSYFVIRYYFFDGESKSVTNKKVKWSVKYKIYGSLAFLDKTSALLYWNVLPEERGGEVESSQITVTLPKNHRANIAKLNTYSVGSTVAAKSAIGNQVKLNLRNISSTMRDFTVEYLIDDGSVVQPAKLNLTMQFPILPANQFILDGKYFDSLKSIPVGKHKLQVGYAGYEYQQFDIDAKSGETINLNINLTPLPWMSALLIIDAVLMLLGLLGIFWWPYRVYRSWQKKGKDQGKIATIIPLYVPPTDIKPYLAGSIRDEKVDQRDITGTIIDLAYRGFIKIKENGNDKYTLIKDTRFKETDVLDEIEQTLFNDLFGSSNEVDLEDLTDFHAKYVNLSNKIYQKMQTAGYFDQSPDKVRNKYYGFGGGYLAIGIMVVVLSLSLFLILLGVIGPITLGFALIHAGIAWLIAAPHMPAKTVLGSQVYNNIEGFKMYMFHAERYRMQNLTPDEFERYLGFAIAFDIEQQWSDSFKNIFKEKPEWYEGNGISVWDIYWADRFVSNFGRNLNSTVFTPAGTSSGSGWSSSGGGFGGGFSGGGGGGGFSGGF